MIYRDEQDYIKLIANIAHDVHKNKDFLHLTPNENILSQTARNIYSTQLSDRYYFGESSNGRNVDLYGFTALGYPGIDRLIQEAKDVFKKRLSVCQVNVSPLSGIHAMICAIVGATKPGDNVLTLGKLLGGHYATDHVLKMLGRNPINIPASKNRNKPVDTESLTRLIKQTPVRAIYIDPAYIIDVIDVNLLRSIMGDETIIIYDASHTLGLILGGAYKNPLTNGANIICANTHKTFPGPHKGIILYGDKKISLAQESDAILNKGLYSSVHTHSTVALAITTLEMDLYGADYSNKIIENANNLGGYLAACGVVSNTAINGHYTNTHQIHIPIDKYSKSYSDLYDRFYESRLAVAFDVDPYGCRFIRLGLQEITRRGIDSSGLELLAHTISQILTDYQPEVCGKNISSVRQSLGDEIKYSFDKGVV
ncbi:hypothetical protein J5A52_01560 [TM7 phylum sp. oral taxon 349]|nr:hypothetical protein J5A52_01560 [TM7 phylum sp. oral taxon 349]